MRRSPGPIRCVASSTRQVTSTSPIVSVAAEFNRSPITVLGLWMPGVSTNTSWASGRWRMPRIWCRVVCGLSETIETFSPRMRFNNVDLPTLGRPTSEAKPDRKVGSVTCPPALRPDRAVHPAGGPE